MKLHHQSKLNQSEELRIFTRSDSVVMASAITTPDAFGDSLNCTRLQTEFRDRFSGSERSAQRVNILSSGDGKKN